MENTHQPTDNQDQYFGAIGLPPMNRIGPEDIKNPEIPRWKVNLLGGGILLVFAFLVYAVISFWPKTPLEGESTKWIYDFTFLNWKGKISAEIRILILVLISGALGSMVHAASSFSNYVGENKIENSWTWWYLLRPFIGMALALVFYLVFRAGLVSNASIEELNIYGIMTLAALAGLFTDRATYKLEEVFESLFHPKDKRSNDLEENGNGIKVDKEAIG